MTARLAPSGELTPMQWAGLSIVVMRAVVDRLLEPTPSILGGTNRRVAH